MTKVPKFSKDEIKFLSEAAGQYLNMIIGEVNQSIVLKDCLGVQKRISVGQSATEKMNKWTESLTQETDSAE